MWFVLSANPDGYDWTFKDAANRQWRKNMRDNNGDGDGVDLNRNFAYKWGYDDEGSSPEQAGQTYRGASANSEPGTKALDAFEKRVGFDYAINYHSAAELPLYGVGWRVATPTPDDEKLIQAEFEKNIPFAMSVAETASHPDRPSSSVGMEAPDFTPAKFTTSYARGGDQEVSVIVRKSVSDKKLNYRINGGRSHDQELRAWKGGETYGGDDNLHFDAYREKAEGADTGDKVDVWFTGRTKSGKRTSSEHFTYTVATRDKGDTLVVAENDAAGVQTGAYIDALKAAGRSPVVWNVARQGAPDPLMVLGHFTSVVHYASADRPGVAGEFDRNSLG